MKLVYPQQENNYALPESAVPRNYRLYRNGNSAIFSRMQTKQNFSRVVYPYFKLDNCWCSIYVFYTTYSTHWVEPSVATHANEENDEKRRKPRTVAPFLKRNTKIELQKNTSTYVSKSAYLHIVPLQSTQNTASCGLQTYEKDQ